MKIVLHITKGPQQGREFVFDSHDTVLCGRSAEAQLSLPMDPAISRHHFLMEINPPRSFIRDLGSSNGTYVNRIRLQETMLRHNDIIAVGDTRIRITVVADPVDAAEEKFELVPVETPPPGAVSAHAAPGDMPAVATAVAGMAGGRAEGEEALLPLVEIPGYTMRRNLSWDAGVGSGLGNVYLADSKSDGRSYAVKLIQPQVAMNERVRKMFVRDIELLTKLAHPAIVQPLAFGPVGPFDFFVTAFVPGKNLIEFVAEAGGRLPIELALDLTAQVLDTLQYAHDRNLLHRDLKPSNIMVGRSAGRPRAFVLDFGLARNYEEAGSMTLTGELRTGLEYMPPEQLRACRSVGPRSDLFSMGAVLYYMLAAHSIYDLEANRQGEMLLAILENRVVPLAAREVKAPPTVAEVIEKALQPRPERRFRSAEEMKQALRKAMPGA